MVALLGVAIGLLACRKERVVTFKVGGAPSARIRYQACTEDVIVGEQSLPWSKIVIAGTSESCARVNADVPRGSPAWCEVWIDGELCDREDDGVWCTCTYDRKRGWSGWPNDDEKKPTRIR